jgi:hypothetical protein
MKKILALMLGLSLLSGTAVVSFGQETNKKPAKKKKKSKKGTDTTEKKAS